MCAGRWDNIQTFYLTYTITYIVIHNDIQTMHMIQSFPQNSTQKENKMLIFRLTSLSMVQPT